VTSRPSDFTADADTSAVGGWVSWHECPEHGDWTTSWGAHPRNVAAYVGDEIPDETWALPADDPSFFMDVCPIATCTSKGAIPPFRVQTEDSLTTVEQARRQAIWAGYHKRPPKWEVNAQEIVESDEPDVTCLPVFGRDGIVVKGWAHLLSAPPKAGKTTLLGHVVRDWLDAGVRICWLTEEPKSVWRKRLKRLGGDWAGLTLMFPGEATEQEFLDAAFKPGLYDVIIVDTVRSFIGCDDENDAAKRGNSLLPWVTSAHATGLTLLLVMHARKGGGQHGEAIAGSHASLAGVDQAIEIGRTGNEDSRRRKLTTLGREFEPVSLLYEMDTEGGLYEIGDTRTVLAKEFDQDILAVMPWGREMSTTEIAAELDPRPNHQRLIRVLTRLCETGRVQRTPPFPEVASTRNLRWTHRAGTD
jgi:DNA repair protein RadA/Sms